MVMPNTVRSGNFGVVVVVVRKLVVVLVVAAVVVVAFDPEPEAAAGLDLAAPPVAIEAGALAPLPADPDADADSVVEVDEAEPAAVVCVTDVAVESDLVSLEHPATAASETTTQKPTANFGARCITASHPARLRSTSRA